MASRLVGDTDCGEDAGPPDRGVHAGWAGGTVSLRRHGAWWGVPCEKSSQVQSVAGLRRPLGHAAACCGRCVERHTAGSLPAFQQASLSRFLPQPSDRVNGGRLSAELSSLAGTGSFVQGTLVLAVNRFASGAVLSCYSACTGRASRYWLQ